MIRWTVWAGVVLFVSCSAGSAQRWEGGPEPRDGACFYRDAYFRGPYLCAEAGQSLDMPPGADDRVSSIRVYGGAEITAYRDSRFGGDSIRFDHHVADLGREAFNDVVSSVRIELSAHARERKRADIEQDPEGIVRRAYQDILERDPDPEGMRLYRSRLIDDGWTEQRLRIDLRRSPEYRDRTTMTPARAEEIVRRAYLRVLGREPDSGDRGYVDGVLGEGWTQSDVEHELQQSAEYRDRTR